MTETNRGFKGIWIPREIWLSKSLSIHEKVMLAELDSLDVDGNGCWASNKFLGDFFGLSERRVRDVLKGLKDKGLIEIQYTYKVGTREIESRSIKISPEVYPHPDIDAAINRMQGAAESCHTPGRILPDPPAESCQTPRQDPARPPAGSCRVDNIYREYSNREYINKGASAKADAQGPDLDTKNFSPELKGKVEEWIQYKKEQRKAYRPTGLRSLLTQIEHNASKYGDHAVAELITECMAANYQGIIFDKLKSRTRVDNQPPMIYDGDDWNPDAIYGQ